MNQLFVREHETLEGLEPPALSEQEARLHYVQSTEAVGRGRSLGLGWSDYDVESSEILYTSSCVIPLDPPFVIRASNVGYRDCGDEGELIQIWRRSHESKSRPDVEAWLQEHGPELDKARRFYSAVRRLKHVASLELKLKELQDAIEVSKVFASVAILEVKAGKRFTQKERDMLFAEFGREAEELG